MSETSETIDVPLKKPVEIKTKAGEVIEKITKITLRPLQGGDFLSALDAAANPDGSVKPGTLLRHLAVKSSGLAADRVNRLDVKNGDMFAVLEAVQSFLPDGRVTGLPALNSSLEPSDFPPTSESGDQDA